MFSRLLATLILISIHALLAESDITLQYAHHFPALFLSTLSLRRATDFGLAIRHMDIQFLSTLSLRRATVALERIFKGIHNFYPRSPCGERPQFRLRRVSHEVFLSTLSLRRATILAFKTCCMAGISIHALLAESDCALKILFLPT